MSFEFLEFERPIADLEAKIQELGYLGLDANIDILAEVEKLKGKSTKLTESIFAKLSANQILQLARHSMRPHTLDYINNIFTDFDELHGDRHFAAGTTLIGGLARLEGQPVMVLGHQKGRTVKEKIKRNFGMPKPEEYRKALRLMELAERFDIPIFTFIDTPGAYPGIDAERRNQSEAIARNLFVMSKLRTPIICTVIGEGGSGGALAIGVGDRVLMLQYSVYSVISPEGCASILWKDAGKSDIAAEAMGITAHKLLSLGLIDEVIPEPLGAAHRNPANMYSALKQTLLRQLKNLQSIPPDSLLSKRYERLMSYGAPSNVYR